MLVGHMRGDSAGKRHTGPEDKWAVTMNRAASCCKLYVPADLDAESLTSMQRQDSWQRRLFVFPVLFLIPEPEAEVDNER